MRWADQGATEALAICDVPDRLSSGLVETAFKAFINDRTNWRKMLSGEPDTVDLAELRDLLLQKTTLPINDVVIPDDPQMTLTYPVTRYPEKVTSLNIEKLSVIEGELWGIKGQYLIFDIGVINIRKYTGYYWKIDA